MLSYEDCAAVLRLIGRTEREVETLRAEHKAAVDGFNEVSRNVEYWQERCVESERKHRDMTHLLETAQSDLQIQIHRNGQQARELDRANVNLGKAQAAVEMLEQEKATLTAALTEARKPKPSRRSRRKAQADDK